MKSILKEFLEKLIKVESMDNYFNMEKWIYKMMKINQLMNNGLLSINI